MTLAPLRVAAVQAVSRAGELDGNVASAVGWVRRAADEGVRLVVLPELFLPGYDPTTLSERPGDCDVTADDIRLEPLREALPRVARGRARGRLWSPYVTRRRGDRFLG